VSPSPNILNARISSIDAGSTFPGKVPTAIKPELRGIRLPDGSIIGTAVSSVTLIFEKLTV
jgi:hypothetical protein